MKKIFKSQKKSSQKASQSKKINYNHLEEFIKNTLYEERKTRGLKVTSGELQEITEEIVDVVKKSFE